MTRRDDILGTTPRVSFDEDSDMTQLVSGAGAQGTMTVYIVYTT